MTTWPRRSYRRRRGRPVIRSASSTWSRDATDHRRTACGWRPSTRATSPDRMIAARLAAILVVTIGVGRGARAPGDGGADASDDASAPPGDAGADTAGTGPDAARDGGDASVTVDAGAAADAPPAVTLRGRVLEKGTR